MDASAAVARYGRVVAVGATLGGLFWGATGFVALLDPGPDPGPVGSSSFYLIEGGHALAETGMAVALLGLWRSQRPRIGRPGNVVFGLAVAATLLLAVITYLVVAGAVLGFRPSAPATAQTVSAPLVAAASALFLFTLVAIVAGYIGSGVTTIRAGVWPPLIGWLLIAHLALLVTNLLIYAAGIVIGILWLGIAWLARRALVSSF